MRPLLFALGLMVAAPTVGFAHAPVAKKEKPKSKDGIITWKVAPENVVIFVDGKKVGPASSAKPFKTKAGMHMVKLVWGKDQAEEPMEVKAGESVEFQYTFEDSGKPAPGGETPAPAP